MSVQRPEFPWERTARVPWEWMRDPRLSLKGKGLLSYLLSHAPGYTVSQGQMVRESTDGRDSVLTGLRELEAAGYLATRPSRADAPRGSGGQFVEHDYLLQDPAATNPTPRPAPAQVSDGYRAENPTVADFPLRSARDGESATKGRKGEEGSKTTLSPATAGAAASQLALVPSHDPFDDFWKVYPRKVGKDAARRAWGKAVRRAEADVIVAAVAAYPFDLSRPQFIPHPSRWLNDGRWQDDPAAVAAGNRSRNVPGANYGPRYMNPDPTDPANRGAFDGAF